MSEVVVQTTAGALRGRRTPHGCAFLGIPYAEPAARAARFAAPVARQPWDGVRDATQHSPTSLQSAYPPPMDQLLPSSDEHGDDHLSLSVWTPDPSADGLPVMVWIHGGAFVRGASSLPTYDGDAFARDGVVLVGINYRLGIAGFPVLPDAPTNLALRDQLAALGWVRDNIASFGGDPRRVTVFGESAGGMSVATLMASPAARGLFSQAIVQSGGGVSVGSPEDLRSVTVAIAEHLCVDATAAAFGAVEPAALLQAQTDVTLQLNLNPDPGRWGVSTIRGGFGIMPVFPALDPELLPEVPELAVASGRGTAVPLLIGTTTDEFRLWSQGLGLGAAVDDASLPVVLQRYGVPQQTVTTYRANRPGQSAGDVFGAVMTDLLFRQPAIRFAQGAAAHGPVHMYEFAWASPVQQLRACHAMELPFVFDTLDTARSGMAGPDAPQQVANRMHAAWVRFATDGDPGWPAYDSRDRLVHIFDTTDQDVLDPRTEERTCWD